MSERINDQTAIGAHCAPRLRAAKASAQAPPAVYRLPRAALTTRSTTEGTASPANALCFSRVRPVT